MRHVFLHSGGGLKTLFVVENRVLLFVERFVDIDLVLERLLLDLHLVFGEAFLDFPEKLGPSLFLLTLLVAFLGLLLGPSVLGGGLFDSGEKRIEPLLFFLVFLDLLRDAFVNGVPVLLQRELLVVVNGKDDLLRTDQLILFAMKLGKIRMFQRLFNRNSFLRIKYQKLPD